MSEKKFVKKLRTFGMSMKVPLTAIIIGAALIPLFLEAGIMLGTFRQSQLDARFIEIQNQCVILSNKMTRSGYMTAEKKNNASLDSQMQTLSDVYNGRIVIVGSNFRVMTDTFNLATGKYYLSEEVIKCFKGENSSHYNKDMQYFAQTIPVYDTADAKAVSGVIVVTASTENILSLTDKVMGKSHLFLVCMVLLISVLGVAAAHLLLRPFKKLQMSFDRVAQGDLDADITEETYRETRLLSQSVQKSLSKLKAVDQSRQEFVSNVSHELKTPITSIKGFAELLCSDMPLGGNKQEAISKRILKETMRMSSLISDIIMISRLESGDITFEREVLDLAAVVSECCSDAAEFARSSKVSISCTTQPCVLSASHREMSELAGNLITNAVKYNRQGGRVEVNLTNENGAPCLRVFNTGEPIAPEYAQRIFERFYRIDKGRSKAAGGTGLGLAIVKHIATNYGASVTVTAAPDGNTFTVLFPVQD